MESSQLTTPLCLLDELKPSETTVAGVRTRVHYVHGLVIHNDKKVHRYGVTRSRHAIPHGVYFFNLFTERFPIPKKRSVFCMADLSLILICKYSEGKIQLAASHAVV